MSKGKIFVDYGKYIGCSIPRFWRILQEERMRGSVKTRHHVFTGKLENGARIKKGWSKNQLEKEFKKYKLDMDERVFLAAAIHSILNELLHNCSPPAIFVNLNCIFDSNSIDCRTKKFFTKFVLYIVEEKLERMIANREYGSLTEISRIDESISQKASQIHLDVNNGNEMRIQDIMLYFDVTKEEIVYYLNRNFLPKDWSRYPSELWDLYLR